MLPGPTATSDIDVNTYCPDGRYNHMQQIEQRLNFLRFLLKVRDPLAIWPLWGPIVCPSMSVRPCVRL